MIDWHDPKEKLPSRGEPCVLLSHYGILAGPIPWVPGQHGGGAWIDLLATPEAGEMIKTKHVWRWALWDQIKPAEQPPGDPSPDERDEGDDAQPPG